MCTQIHATPPGFSLFFNNSKKSAVKRAPTPEIQGLDGSEMITSYFWSAKATWFLPSATMSFTRGSSRASWLNGSKNREPSITADEISIKSIESTGNCSTAPRVIPLPCPITNADFGWPCSNMGRYPESSCVRMSIASEASVLPLTRRKIFPETASSVVTVV